jgi:hypothetical protein
VKKALLFLLFKIKACVGAIGDFQIRYIEHQVGELGGAFLLTSLALLLKK